LIKTYFVKLPALCSDLDRHLAAKYKDKPEDKCSKLAASCFL